MFEQVIDHPESRIDTLQLASAATRTSTDIWNRTSADLGPTRTVHGLFEEQTHATPEAIAVRSGVAACSYQELHEKSSELANALVAIGQMPGAVIALGMQRSIDMVVALLGILKAGCAYLPLDPDALPIASNTCSRNQA
jgi:non-ribosomal peptide synthetase component F